MKPIIVTAATHLELSLLINTLEAGDRLFIGHREIFEGTIGGRRTILAITGIGKVNAASTVTALLEHFAPELLINIGCAGAYTESGLKVGELALATAELFGDEGVVTPDGWHSLELIGIPVVSRNGEEYYNRFPLARWAEDKAAHVAETNGLTLHPGVFVTVSCVSGSAERGAELFLRFGGICENMEGAAVAQVASLYGVDCMELRGVSNLVENRDLSRWDIPLAAEQAQKFTIRFISALYRTE
jgi:futalosine hydrolase